MCGALSAPAPVRRDPRTVDDVSQAEAEYAHTHGSLLAMLVLESANMNRTHRKGKRLAKKLKRRARRRVPLPQ